MVFDDQRVADGMLLKRRSIDLIAVPTESIREELIQRIKILTGISHCVFGKGCLTVQYDLQQTSLQCLVEQIEPILTGAEGRLNNGVATRLKRSLINFVETNQRSNINELSDWQSMVKDVYLLKSCELKDHTVPQKADKGLATISEHDSTH